MKDCNSTTVPTNLFAFVLLILRIVHGSDAARRHILLFWYPLTEPFGSKSRIGTTKSGKYATSHVSSFVNYAS